MNHKLNAIGCILLICTLAGCTTATAVPTPTPAKPTPTYSDLVWDPEFDTLGVGIVLPTKDEPVWRQAAERFKDALISAGYDVEILFSQDSTIREKQNVENLIAGKFEILIICPVDANEAAAAAQEAGELGLKIISFDRLIRDTEAVDYYVTFNAVEVGEKQGKFLVDEATGKGNSLFLYSGPTRDEYSFWFFEGAWNKLQPKIADGTFVIQNSSEAVALQDKPDLTRDEMARIIDQISTDWDPTTAHKLAEANLTAITEADKNDSYILAPNDRTARAIAVAFLEDLDVTRILITGQDGEKASLQDIIDSKQSMTVLKDMRLLVDDAIQAAIAFLEGGTPVATTTYNNGMIDVPANPPEVVIVTQANFYETIIESGYYPESDFRYLFGDPVMTPIKP